MATLGITGVSVPSGRVIVMDIYAYVPVFLLDGAGSSRPEHNIQVLDGVGGRIASFVHGKLFVA